MAWYNPLTRFKNTPTQQQVKNEPISPKPWIIENPTINNILAQNTIAAKSSVATLSPDTSVWWENPFADNRPWYQKILRGIQMPSAPSIAQTSEELEARWKQDRAKQKATQLSWFSLDPYNINQWLWLENSFIDHSVDIEEEEIEDDTPESIKLLDKSIQIAKDDPIKWALWMWASYFMGMRELANLLPNTAKDVGTWVWKAWKELWQSNALENKYWWDLEYKTNITLDDLWWDEVSATIKYNSEAKEELFEDISKYLYIKNAYDEWQIWEATFEETKDMFYDKYKDKFIAKDIVTPVLWWVTTNGSAFQNKIITKWTFFDFVDNEVTKQWAIAELAEQSELAKALSDEKSQERLAQAVDYSRSIFWPAVQNSTISTVEARQEYMNDATRNAQETYWRRNAAMTMSYREKSHLQKIYNTTDLSQVDLPDWYKEAYDDILRGEKAFEQMIKNHSEWISLTASYADPETWKIEKSPDAIVDPETGKYVQYNDFLFKWIDMEWHRLPWIPYWMQSPQDVLDYNSRKVSYKVEQMEWSAIMDAWEAVQYWWANVWAFINELWQQTLWRVYSRWWNLLSEESWEVPFAFTNMDTSIMATMTTNDSWRGRLLQNFFQQTADYLPEVTTHVIVDYYIWKWLNNIGELAQIRTMWLLNKIPWARNTLWWRQFSELISYVPRAMQLIWTDQTIDAIASIADTEHLSDFSKKISIWWMLLWEWIWIMRDLGVLADSFFMNFNKTARANRGILDPIRLIADNPELLNKYAAAIWRTSKDASWKIVGDQYKLLLQDLRWYSKNLNKMVNEITDAIKNNIWNVNLSQLNQDTKQAAYNVLKQVFHQDSAMARAVTALLTDSRANIADMVKYIWDLDWTIRIWPWISTIKLTDRAWNTVTRTVEEYAPWMDLVIEWWLVRWINRWLTRQEIDNLISQWFINQTSARAMESNMDEYFSAVTKDWSTVYYPTEKWLSILWEKWVSTNVVWDPLAIVTMSKNTRELIDKLKSLPQSKRPGVSDNLLEQMWETNAIDSLARDIADIDILDICK